MRMMFKYRLNENAPANEMKIADILLKKSWICNYNKAMKLESFIRTKKNPDGIVDYEQINVDENNKVVESSYTDFVTPVKVYTREHLSVKTRKELIEIARPFKIDCGELHDNFIIKKIIEKQSEFMKLQEELDEKRKFEEISKKILETGEDLEFLP